ncbi:hypothetical protein BDV37DRAFT_259213 [Aspergillus pseudonomiae]|uniref:Uncharacterized protein n=1 Tax=Aspergillus pseudonomiae TaxID=1506151 RepID=A0A5N7D1U9_9EURO|nr:uncharacterized protein BDV37DRAFT_259213 [Aspergillus pseudonomiae]KAE8399833.1 hypothetical protein BDV37DRAFT_259213 [Aspergillus pseudonomiae]
MEPVLPVHILPRHDNPIQYPCHSFGRWKYHPVGVPTDLQFIFIFLILFFISLLPYTKPCSVLRKLSRVHLVTETS